jgi:tetratricopeptide (TPR) repeat protein
LNGNCRRPHGNSLQMVLRYALLVILLVAGCSSYRSELQRAEALEQAGKCVEALPILDRAIPAIPAGATRARSLAYVRLGQCLSATQRHGDALAAYQRAVQLDADNLDAREKLGALYVLGGLPQDGAPHAEKILASNPGDVRGLTLLASIALATGRRDEAEALFRTAIAADPARTESVLAFAELLDTTDRRDAAREVLMTASKSAPGKPEIWLALGRLEEQAGNSAAAEVAYRSAVRAQDSPEANLRLAQFLQRIARSIEAEAVLRHVDELQPIAISSTGDFQVATGRARHALTTYFQRLAGLETKAIDQKQSALLARLVEAQLQSSHDTTYARALLNQNLDRLAPGTVAVLRAEIALVERRLPQAEAEAQRAVMLAPTDAASHYVTGLAQSQLGRDEEGRAAWTRALELDPLHIASRLMIAGLDLKAANIDAAESHAVIAVRQEPANLTALEIYTRVLLAQKRTDAAKAIWTRVNAIAPSALNTQLLAGEIALAENNLAAALVMFQRALIETPTSPEALNGLLRVYREGKFTRPMLRQLERVAEAPPSSAVLMEIAGRLYAEKGWTSDAIRALGRSVELNRYRTTARTALADLHLWRDDLAAAATASSEGLLRGLEAQQRGDMNAAIRAYEDAVQHGDISGVAANNLAWLYAEQGTSLDRALEMAEIARRNAPKNGAVLDTLGFVLLKRREFTAAIDVLKQAVELSDGISRPIVAARLQEAYAAAGVTALP